MSANASTPVAQTMTTSTGATRQSAADQARLAAKVATFSSQDRWFERVTFLFAALVLLAMAGILVSLLREFGGQRPMNIYTNDDYTRFAKVPLLPALPSLPPSISIYLS
jgi:hypothetical protein